MPALGVNIDHVATVRQARRTYEPDPLEAARQAEAGGADGITVHLREDRRHIQDADVVALRRAVRTRLNLEMAATDEMVRIANSIRPETAMLVPEGRHEVTTEGGLDILADEPRLREVVARLREGGVPASVFIDADPAQIEAAARIGAAICEIHTGPYAIAFHEEGDAAGPRTQELHGGIARAGAQVQSLGMRFNAGHGLNYRNVRAVATLPGLHELHIGHSIVSHAVFVGIREAVRQMKALLA